jgi:hypothetical protein
MLLISRLRSPKSNRSSRAVTLHRPSTARFRPRLEALEDRRLPSTLTVTNTRDDLNPGSLRWAIDQANISYNYATIVFDPRLDGQTIWLYSGELLIQNNMTIQGPGAGLLAISRYDSSNYRDFRVFDVEPFRGNNVTLSGLTIENGVGVAGDPSGAQGGGGVLNSGNLTISGCTITNNTATVGPYAPYAYGGGISNRGTLTVSGCTLSGNNAAFGGGIYNRGTLTMSGCTLSGNHSTGAGGGMANYHMATLTNCTLNNNSAGGGGGGIVDPYGAMTVTNCTFSNNSAHLSGGALNISQSATLINCTLSLNSATTGGGIWVNPARGGGVLNLANTIVAGNTASVSGPDVSGAVATADHDLVGDATGSSGIVNGSGGNIVGGNGHPVINADLGPLQNNGGPTQTMAFLAGSPAIDQADNSKAPATDERGIKRLDVSGETTDIGAFEL